MEDINVEMLASFFFLTNSIQNCALYFSVKSEHANTFYAILFYYFLFYTLHYFMKVALLNIGNIMPSALEYLLSATLK